MTAKAHHYPWHLVIEGGLQAGLSTKAIHAAMKVKYPEITTSQISGHLQRHRMLTVRGDNVTAMEWEDRAARATEDVRQKKEIYDWLRPVELPAPIGPRVTTTANTSVTLVAGDFHFPHHDEAACSIFLQTVAALRPYRVILNGDTVDLFSVSKYPADARKQFKHGLRDEVVAFHGFLRQLHDIGNAWGLEVVETNSNHAGNGVDGRWWRYLSDRCPELLTHDEAEERLSYQSWFYPKWSNIRLVENVVIADSLLVIHGDKVRSQPGYSARAHGTAWRFSLLHNHTHRRGESGDMEPAIPGVRTEGQLEYHENGCMCVRNPIYAKTVNWQPGFSVITHDDEARMAQVDFVRIREGRAIVGALGVSFDAS